MPGLLGKRPPRRDSRTLRLARYLTLPTPPADVDYTARVVSSGGYGMLANDRLGCCVISGMMHLAMQQSINDGRPMAVPSDAEVIAAYSAIGGYVPGDETTDQGIVMLDALKHWRKRGLTINGKRNRIAAFAAVDPHDAQEVAAAHWLFGGLLDGYALPAAVQTASSWSNPPADLSGDWRPGTWGGHCVLEGADTGGVLKTVTWGKLVETSAGFFRAYCDESYAVLSDAWLGDDNLCPAGFDRKALLKDLEAL